MNKIKTKIALINIDNFGINLCKNQSNNLIKEIPFSHWKNLINVFHNSKVISYKENNYAFKQELYDVFETVERKWELFSDDFKENLVKTIKYIFECKKKNPDFSVKNIQIFLNIDNDFFYFNFELVERFFLALQKALKVEELLLPTETIVFNFNLIVDEAVFDYKFFTRSLTLLSKNSMQRLFLVHSIICSHKILGICSEKKVVDCYFKRLFHWIHNRPKGYDDLRENSWETLNVETYTSMLNLKNQILQNNEISSFYLNDTMKNNVFKQADLVLFFNFEDEYLKNFHKEFISFNNQQEHKHPHLNLVFNSNKITNILDNSLESKKHRPEATVITQRLSFEPLCLEMSDHFNVHQIKFDYNCNNPYIFVLKYVDNFFENIKKQLNQTEVLVIQMNLLRLVKQKFGLKIWLFSLVVFDLYISKITSFLNQNNVNWLLGSSAYGFETCFCLTEEQKITFMTLSNFLSSDFEIAKNKKLRFNPGNEIQSINFYREQIKQMLKLIDNKVNWKVFKQVINSQKINQEIVKIKQISSDEKFNNYLKRSFLSKKYFNILDEQKIQKMNANNNFLNAKKSKFNFKKFQTNITNYQLGNYYLYWFKQEQKLYAQSPDLSLVDMNYFYKRLFYFYKNQKWPVIGFQKNDSMDNFFLSLYRVYLESLFANLGYTKYKQKPINKKKTKQPKGDAFNNFDDFEELFSEQFDNNPVGAVKFFTNKFHQLTRVYNNYLRIKQELNKIKNKKYFRYLEMQKAKLMNQENIKRIWVKIYLDQLVDTTNDQYQNIDFLTLDNGHYEYSDLYKSEIEMMSQTKKKD